MSSWANRNLPRRRDLSQIPEPLRPTIVPRAMQPLVIESEALLPKPEWPMGAYAMKQAATSASSSSSNDFVLPYARGGTPMNEILYPGRLQGSISHTTSNSSSQVWKMSVLFTSVLAKEEKKMRSGCRTLHVLLGLSVFWPGPRTSCPIFRRG